MIFANNTTLKAQFFHDLCRKSSIHSSFLPEVSVVSADAKKHLFEYLLERTGSSLLYGVYRQEAAGPGGQDVGGGHCQADGHGAAGGGPDQVRGNRQVCPGHGVNGLQIGKYGRPTIFWGGHMERGERKRENWIEKKERVNAKGN